MRADLDELAARARALGLPLALAPSVTPLLDEERVASFRGLGVRVASISLDGASAATHDGIRGVPGHFDATLEAIRRLRRHGITVQVNTVVMRDTVDELPAIARLVQESGASIWELFFLVHVGRGESLGELTPEENEHVCHFLVDASRLGLIVRTVEAPFFRRVARERAAGADPPAGGLYRRLVAGLGPLARARARADEGDARRTRHRLRRPRRDDHAVRLPARSRSATSAATTSSTSTAIIRCCGASAPPSSAAAAACCTYRDLCGGSRARAYATYGDPLAEDPGCAFYPQV